MSRIKEIISELFDGESYNQDFVDKSKICRETDTIPKVENAGQVITIDGENCIVMHNGVLVYEGSYHGQWMTDTIKNLSGHHEPQEEKLFHEVLKYISPNSLMIECGSFWAYYSLWFHKQIQGSKNILIEPIPLKFELSKANFELNGFDGTFVNGFIGEVYKENSIFTDWDMRTYNLTKFSIDSLVEKFQIERIHLLHADIQECEHSLITGSEKSLENQIIDFIFLATHQSNKPYIKMLENKKYKIINHFETFQSYADDGLILACSPSIYEKLDLKNFGIQKK